MDVPEPADRLIVASNRGPVSWTREDGETVAHAGDGGLVVALGDALHTKPRADPTSPSRGTSAGEWVSVALSDDDAAVAEEHAGGPFTAEVRGGPLTLRLVDPGKAYERYYEQVANRMLWFTLHELWAEPYEPAGTGWREAWDDYLEVNRLVAEAVVAAVGDDADVEVHLQDYHLLAAAPTIREALPHARVLHYVHTPWPEPLALRRLPDRVVTTLLDSLLACDLVAVSSPRWAEGFRRCACDLGGARRDGDAVRRVGRSTAVGSFTLGVDRGTLTALGDSDDVARERADLEALVGDRRLVVRADRSDLSKNVLRGLQAYAELLEREPERREDTVHVALLNPSRQDVPEYASYLERCQEEAEAIRRHLGDDVLHLEVGGNYPRVVAALQLADVVLTNPVIDGTNLVAKEAAVLSRRDAVLVLSPYAGAADVMGDAALLANPYDVEAQADALSQALAMPEHERGARARRLAEAAVLGSPGEWLADQREALARACATP